MFIYKGIKQEAQREGALLTYNSDFNQFSP